jgi:voltage-gated potassium channel
MAQLITKPSVIQFLDLLESVEGKFAIEQVTYDELKPEHQGSSIREMNIRNMSGVSVVAHQTIGGTFKINPPANTVLEPSGNFIVLGSREELDHFQVTFLNKKKKAPIP